MNMDNLTGLDKSAILFKVLGESLSLSMFQNISEADLMRIRVRSRELRNIPLDLRQSILEEYYFKMMSTQYHNLDKDDNKLFSFLTDLNDEQVYAIIHTEPVKVIALALDQLSPKRKIRVMDRFSPEMKHSIIMELGKLEEVPLEGVVNVAKELRNKTSFLPSPKEFSRGGPRSIANILGQMGSDEADQYLEQISTEDPELYIEVKKYFLSFEDLLTMPEHIMRVYWRSPAIDIDNLSKAFKGQDEETVNKIVGYLAKRNQAKYTPYEQPLSKRELDSAQSSFVQLARTLHEKEEINLDDVLESTDYVE